MSELTRLDDTGPMIRRRRSTTWRAERHCIWCLRSEGAYEDLDGRGKMGGEQGEVGNPTGFWAAGPQFGMVEMSLKTPTID